MNEQLKTVLDFIQQNENISAEEKSMLVKEVKKVNSDLEIAEFKLERTEKVKRTTAILLEETIEELEQKRKAVEEQNRDLEIESSLERVRTVAMGMRKPDDMLDVCQIISQQSESLGIKEIRNVQTAIIYEEKGTYLNYEYYAKHEKLLVTEVDYKNHELQSLFANQMLRGAEELFATALTGKEVKDWYDYQKTTNQFADSYLENAQSLNYYFYSLGPVALGISTYSPLSDEEISLFKRFRNVFDLAYRRFLDIEKAEAQAREAKIEASLERVRAQALSMRKPDDLPGICEVLFTELSTLGFTEIRNAMINIHDDEKASFVNYDYSDAIGQSINHLTYNIHPLVEKQIKQVRSATGFSETSFKGKDLKDWIAFRKKIGEKDDPRIENTDALYYYFYSIGTGSIGISTFSSITDEKLDVLKRFRNVFDFAYRRYTDVAQAEAQAREAQVELALERVRARTMAMQRSTELAESATLLFAQVKSLGVEAFSCGFNIWNSDGKSCTSWMSNIEGGIMPSIQIPLLSDPNFIHFYESMKKGEFFYEFEMIGEALQAHYIFLRSFPAIDETFKKRLKAGFLIPKKLIHNVVNFSQGNLMFITLDRCPDAHDIFKRFAKVFEQTYTRFLDLQKAEAQAREAQIEAALERVRSRTMGMQKSEELKEVIKIVYKQLIQLKINLDHAGFVVDYKPSGDWHFWIADEQDIPSEITHPYFESVWANQFNEAKVKGEDIFVTNLNFEEKNKFYQELLSYIPGLPEASKVFYLSCPGLAATTVLFNNVGLYIENFSHIPYTDEENTILMRFGKVFQQTYTRFLDLQKAEAQAREARIEAALERVRSRTLAMQKSDELAETSAVLFQQLIQLGIEPNRLYITIIKGDQANAEFWITDEDGSKVSSAFETNLNNNPVFKKMLEGWKGKKSSLTIDMKGEELQEYFRYLSSLNVPFKGGLAQTRRIQYLGYFNKGFIGMASPVEQPEETIQLLARFAAVFNLTFTRFNDLKIAEAHAIQAEEDLVKLQTEKQRAEEALAELQVTQKQLIQAEKMASLGELTAGIAHEIQNPLNFVNNFSEVSNELLDEMKAELDSGDIQEAKAIASDVKLNLEKILHHGKRADAIVKGMLQHSRSSSGVKEPTDINALADEYLRLAYHGLRAKDKSFNATLKTDFDESIGKIDIIPQDIGRVILNLITNAFYAVDEKMKQMPSGFEPSVSISTRKNNGTVEIKVTDNGNGIPQKVLDKIFQPFFTTKPTGEGTGLGLSLAYDIVKAHGGELRVETKENQGTTFIVRLAIPQA